MAPLRPAKSAAKRRVSHPALHRPVKASGNTEEHSFFGQESDEAFITTKKDKQRIKHSLLLSKLKPNAAGRSAGIQKRRRSNKKLKTSLNSLADVLPDVSDIPATLEERAVAARLTSVGHKRGSGKKREKMLKEEKARFGQNMAILTGMRGSSEKTAETGDQEISATNDRWSALRQSVAANMGVSATKGT